MVYPDLKMTTLLIYLHSAVFSAEPLFQGGHRLQDAFRRQCTQVSQCEIVINVTVSQYLKELDASFSAQGTRESDQF